MWEEIIMQKELFLIKNTLYLFRIILFYKCYVINYIISMLSIRLNKLFYTLSIGHSNNMIWITMLCYFHYNYVRNCWHLSPLLESKERELICLYKDRRSENENSHVCSYSHCDFVAFSPPALNDMTSSRLHLPDNARYNSSTEDFVAENFKPPRNLDFVFDRAKRHAGEPRKFSVHETPSVNFLPWHKFTPC